MKKLFYGAFLDGGKFKGVTEEIPQRSLTPFFQPTIEWQKEIDRLKSTAIEFAEGQELIVGRILFPDFYSNHSNPTDIIEEYKSKLTEGILYPFANPVEGEVKDGWDRFYVHQLMYVFNLREMPSDAPKTEDEITRLGDVVEDQEGIKKKILENESNYPFRPQKLRPRTFYAIPRQIAVLSVEKTKKTPINMTREQYFERCHPNKPRFHWRDDIYFMLESDASVTVLKIRLKAGEVVGNGEIVEEIGFTIPALEWASIVTSMSKGGETSESYYSFLKFHKEGVSDQAEKEERKSKEAFLERYSRGAGDKSTGKNQ